MATQRIILARHGETELNRLHIVQGSGVNPGLNEEGREQARELCAVFAGQVDRLVTSGMLRAEETVAPLVAEGTVAETDERLREVCWGVHEGKVGTPALRDEYKQLMSDWEAGRLDARIPGGESAAELADRLRAAWRDLAETTAATTFVCLHGRALRCLVAIVDGVDVRHMNRYPHSNAGYYLVEKIGGTWQLTEQNVTRHLSQAPQSFTS